MKLKCVVALPSFSTRLCLTSDQIGPLGLTKDVFQGTVVASRKAISISFQLYLAKGFSKIFCWTIFFPPTSNHLALSEDHLSDSFHHFHREHFGWGQFLSCPSSFLLTPTFATEQPICSGFGLLLFCTSEFSWNFAIILSEYFEIRFSVSFRSSFSAFV